MPAAVVCTTILDPPFLDPLCENLRKYHRVDHCTIWIIPDRKTPAAAAARAAEWLARGFDIRYVTIPEQRSFLARLPEMDSLIPFDSDNRRNVGFLMALDAGADVVISIDDDNEPETGVDFVGEHNITGRVTDSVIHSDNAWFNICTAFHVEPAWPIYPRGFPYRIRRAGPPVYRHRFASLPVGMNIGLWLDDPDVDAITRNYHRFRVIGWDGRVRHLAPGTWTPINTQNTALLAELIPAYYYLPMNEHIAGLRIDRFGDIFSGLFCKKVCDTLGYAVRVGGPICRHRRTPHDLLKDLHEELAGLILLEEITAWLEPVRLAGKDAAEIYLCLADELDAAVPHFGGYLWCDEARRYFRKITRAMRAWIRAIRTIEHAQPTTLTAAC